MLPLIALMLVLAAPFMAIYAAMIADDLDRAKQARNFGRMMSDPRVVAAHRAAENYKV